MSLTAKDIELRKGIMTGSRIARVIGESPFGGPFSVYLELAEGFEQATNDSMVRGHVVEPYTLAWETQRSGQAIEPVGTLIHPKHKRIGATPDGLKRDAGRVVEAKSTIWAMSHLYGMQGTDEIASYYLPQVHFEMGVTGTTHADVPIAICDAEEPTVLEVAGQKMLIGVREFRWYEVEFDPEYFGLLVDAAEKFLRDHVDTKRPPPPDGSEAADEWIARNFPTHRAGKVLPATPELNEIAIQFSSTHMAIKDLEKQKAKLYQRLTMLMEDAEAVETGLGLVTYKKTKDGTYVDKESLLASLPEELILQYTRPKQGSRTLRGPWSKKQ